MKRKAIYIIMVSLLAAAAVSCTREFQAPDGEEATLTVTASLDAAMDGGTKASDDGALTNLADQGYQLRYMMELWSENDNVETLEYRAKPVITDFSSLTVEYNLNLLAKKYKMVLWADIVKKGDNSNVYNGKYDISDGLTAIGFPEGSAFGSDEYDAFTAVADVDLTDGSKLIGATLKRPFAKIRVIDDRINQDPAQHYSTHLEFPSTVPIPKTYNALTGGITYSDTEDYNTYTCQSVFETDRLCLFTGYIFVPETGAYQQSTKYSFTIVVNDEKKVQVSDVTVRRNALTTVKGKLL